MEGVGIYPPIIMKESDVSAILNRSGSDNFLGKGAVGAVYRFDYYGIHAVAKIPIQSDKIETMKREIVIYNYICKVFNRCACRNNIVQMLGYDNEHGIIMLELFDGSDLIRYTGYPMNPSTFLTHRLEPRTHVGGSADFTTLGKYLRTSNSEETILKLFDHIYTGLLCLHSAKIVHKDLELKNILIRSDGKVGITDFGASRILDQGSSYYGFNGLFAGMRVDTDKVGPMMGNFLDSCSKQPYQYRLDLGSVDNIIILNNIFDTHLKDAFMVLVLFPDIVAFISLIYYINRNIDRDSGAELIDDAAGTYNDNIDAEIPEHIRESMYISTDITKLVVDGMYNNLVPEATMYDLIRYFRLIISSLIASIGIPEIIMESESVHDFLTRSFKNKYMEYVTAMADSVRYGYLLTNFNLFQTVYTHI
jgi:serine/threonine protein kinase